LADHDRRNFAAEKKCRLKISIEICFPFFPREFIDAFEINRSSSNVGHGIDPAMTPADIGDDILGLSRIRSIHAVSFGLSSSGLDLIADVFRRIFLKIDYFYGKPRDRQAQCHCSPYPVCSPCNDRNPTHGCTVADGLCA
jgi:hypothetical protein